MHDSKWVGGGGGRGKERWREGGGGVLSCVRKGGVR